eukprot:767058-Hanusia_phi.AAC.6
MPGARKDKMSQRERRGGEEERGGEGRRGEERGGWTAASKGEGKGRTESRLEERSNFNVTCGNSRGARE